MTFSLTMFGFSLNFYLQKMGWGEGGGLCSFFKHITLPQGSKQGTLIVRIPFVQNSGV